MTDNITIPDEVVEAAARAAFVYYMAIPWVECADKPLWRTLARAACLAMLKAWPNRKVLRDDGRRQTYIVPALILPLPTQETDNE